MPGGGGLASQWRTIWRKSAASWVDRWRLLEYSRGVLTWPSGWSRTRGRRVSVRDQTLAFTRFLDFCSFSSPLTPLPVKPIILDSAYALIFLS